MGKRYVVIPAYEPGENLPALVSEVAAAGLDPVVVDDGSGQGYREIFEQVTAEGTVLHHEENKGKGQALKTAFFYIIKNNEAENGDDFFVVTMDSDGQHTVADALKLLKAAEKEPQTLILGSRALKKERRQGAALEMTSRGLCSAWRAAAGCTIPRPVCGPFPEDSFRSF